MNLILLHLGQLMRVTISSIINVILFFNGIKPDVSVSRTDPYLVANITTTLHRQWSLSNA